VYYSGTFIVLVMARRTLKIVRLYEQPTLDPKQTIGNLYVVQDDVILYECYTLELPYLDNQRRISCIPADTYTCRKRSAADSPSRNYDHIHILDVPNRSWILIHKGNFYTDILGCILVGTDLRDVNGDGICDVVRSGTAFETIMNLMPNVFELTIEYRT
jgi:hypothetical protein